MSKAGSSRRTSLPAASKDGENDTNDGIDSNIAVLLKKVKETTTIAHRLTYDQLTTRISLSLASTEAGDERFYTIVDVNKDLVCNLKRKVAFQIQFLALKSLAIKLKSTKCTFNTTRENAYGVFIDQFIFNAVEMEVCQGGITRNTSTKRGILHFVDAEGSVEKARAAAAKNKRLVRSYKKLTEKMLDLNTLNLKTVIKKVEKGLSIFMEFAEGITTISSRGSSITSDISSLSYNSSNSGDVCAQDVKAVLFDHPLYRLDNDEWGKDVIKAYTKLFKIYDGYGSSSSLHGDTKARDLFYSTCHIHIDVDSKPRNLSIDEMKFFNDVVIDREECLWQTEPEALGKEGEEKEKSSNNHSGSRFNYSSSAQHKEEEEEEEEESEEEEEEKEKSSINQVQDEFEDEEEIQMLRLQRLTAENLPVVVDGEVAWQGEDSSSSLSSSKKDVDRDSHQTNEVILLRDINNEIITDGFQISRLFIDSKEGTKECIAWAVYEDSGKLYRIATKLDARKKGWGTLLYLWLLRSRSCYLDYSDLMSTSGKKLYDNVCKSMESDEKIKYKKKEEEEEESEVEEEEESEEEEEEKEKSSINQVQDEFEDEEEIQMLRLQRLTAENLPVVVDGEVAWQGEDSSSSLSSRAVSSSIQQNVNQSGSGSNSSSSSRAVNSSSMLESNSSKSEEESEVVVNQSGSGSNSSSSSRAVNSSSMLESNSSKSDEESEVVVEEEDEDNESDEIIGGCAGGGPLALMISKKGLLVRLFDYLFNCESYIVWCGIGNAEEIYDYYNLMKSAEERSFFQGRLKTFSCNDIFIFPKGREVMKTFKKEVNILDVCCQALPKKTQILYFTAVLGPMSYLALAINAIECCKDLVRYSL